MQQQSLAATFCGSSKQKQRQEGGDGNSLQPSPDVLVAAAFCSWPDINRSPGKCPPKKKQAANVQDVQGNMELLRKSHRQRGRFTFLQKKYRVCDQPAIDKTECIFGNKKQFIFESRRDLACLTNFTSALKLNK